MNIIISGDSEMGYHLAKTLSGLNHSIVVIDPNEEALNLFDDNNDILGLVGSSTSIDILKKADITKADLVISVLHEEEVNIVTASIAKKLGAKKTIARINSPEYLLKNNKEIIKSLGIDYLVSPEWFAAKEIIDLLKQTASSEVFEFSEGMLSVFLLKLDKDAPVINKTLEEIVQGGNLNFRALAIRRNGETIIPNGNDKFIADDLAYVISKHEGIEDLMKHGGKHQLDIKNIMIVGGGRIGRITAKSLGNDFNIKLVEINKNRSYDLSNYLDETNVLIINGDARDIDLLIDEEISSMDAFISVTENSETNLLTCLLARKYGHVKKTIALVENVEYIEIAQNMGIDAVINKKLTASSYISRFTMEAEVTSLKCLNGIDGDILEFIVKEGSKISKSPIKNLKFPKGAVIGGVVRNGEANIAIGDFQIQKGDKVVVFCLPEIIHDVNNFFN